MRVAASRFVVDRHGAHGRAEAKFARKNFKTQICKRAVDERAVK